LVQAEPTAGDWPQWRGPNRDGISTEKGWLTQWPKGGPKMLWKAKVGSGHCSVAIAGDRLYTMGFLWKTNTDGKPVKDKDGKSIGSHVVYCLEASTGKEVWKYAYEFPMVSSGDQAHSTPTVHDGFVYSLSVLGKLFCFDAASGKVIWSKDLIKDFNGKRPYYGYSGSPLIVQDLVVVMGGGQQGLVVALHRKTGQTVWQYGKDGTAGDYSLHSSPVPYEASGKKSGIVICIPGAVVGVCSRDGKELWRHPSDEAPTMATPVVCGDKVFFSGSGAGRQAVLLQLTQDQPKVVWQNKEMTQCWQSSVLVDGYLYGTHAANGGDAKRTSVRCVAFDSGTVKWEQAGFGHAPLIAADGKLIIMDERGELVVAEASPKEFKELARVKVLGGRCWGCPVLCRGRIYCRNEGGDLVCLDVKAP